MGTPKAEAKGAASGLFGWLKYLKRKDKAQTQQQAQQQQPAHPPPGSPRASSRTRVAAEEQQGQVPSPTGAFREIAKSSPNAILQSVLSNRRAQTWVAEPGEPPLATRSGAVRDVVLDRLNSFNPPGPPTGRSQPQGKRLALLSAPLTQAGAAGPECSMKGKPSGGHTVVEELDPQGTQDSFTRRQASTAPVARNPHSRTANIMADLNDLRERFPRSADNIPRSFDGGEVSGAAERRSLRPCVSGISSCDGGPCVEPEDSCAGGLQGGGMSSPRSGRPLSGLRNAQCPPTGHSRSRLGGMTSDGSGGAGPGGSRGHQTNATTLKTTTTTDTSNTNTTKNCSDVTTNVFPAADGRGANVETTKLSTSTQESSQRKVVHETEVEDVRDNAPTSFPSARFSPGHDHAMGTPGLVDGDGPSRWRHRETERRNVSHSRRLHETRTEEASSQKHGGLEDALRGDRRCSSKTVTTTQREEEEEREERHEETVTQEVLESAPPGGQRPGHRGDGPPACSSRFSRTSQVSSQHTVWRMKTSSRTHVVQQGGGQPTSPATPPQPPPPATAAWTSGPPGKEAAAAATGAAGGPPGVARGGGGTCGPSVQGQDGSGSRAGGGTIADPVPLLRYERQPTLTQEDLATLSGGQPYLGLESRTDILGRFLDDADDGVLGGGAGRQADVSQLHPPPMTPGARSAASIAAPVRPHHIRHEQGGTAAYDGAGGERPVSRIDRRAGYAPSWGHHEQQQQRGPYPYVSSSTQHRQQRTTTSQHTAEFRTSTITTGHQHQQHQHQHQQHQHQHQHHQQQHQHKVTTSTVTRTQHVQESAGGRGGPAIQRRTEETVQEVHDHHQQRSTITCVTGAGAGTGAVTGEKTDRVLREAVKRLSGPDGVAVPGIENTDDDEEQWDATGAGRKSRRQRRVRIASTTNWPSPGQAAARESSGGLPGDGQYGIDTSWDAYASGTAGGGGGGAGGGKSFISRSGKSLSTRMSPPRTAGGLSHSGAADGYGRGWDNGDDKYNTSSRALAAQAQLMRASRSRNAAAALTVVTSALNPLTWQSAISPTANSGGLPMYGAAGGIGNAGGVTGGASPAADVYEARGVSGAQVAVPQQQHQQQQAGNPPNRRHQSSPGNTDIPGFPALLSTHQHNDRSAAGVGYESPAMGASGGGGAFHGGGVTGRTNLILSAGLAELSAGLAGLSGGNAGGRRLR